jgi:membrane protease YdiL (CAAX protease family)
MIDVRREDHLVVFAVVAWTLAASTAGRVGVWASVGGVAVLLGTLVIVRDPAVRGLLVPSWPRLALGLAAAGTMMVATYLLWPLLRTVSSFDRELRTLYAAFRTVGPTGALLLLGPVVVGEELVWRGAVQGALARRTRPPAAVVLAAALYALAHALIGSPLLVLTAFACGLFWGALRTATGSLVPSLVSHVVWDAAVLVVFPLAR